MGSDGSTSLAAGRLQDVGGRVDCAELSQELQTVQWLALKGPTRTRSRPAQVALGWTFELTLVVAGALIGVGLYFAVG